MLQSTCRCWHSVVWSLRDEHQQVYLFLVDVVVCYQLFCGSKAKVRRACLCIRETTLFDTCLVNNIVSLLCAQYFRIFTVLNHTLGYGSRHRCDANALILYICHTPFLLFGASIVHSLYSTQFLEISFLNLGVILLIHHGYH